MGDSDDDDNKFDASRKIMVAAIFSLFAVVILVIILHFYARYLLRREERRQLRAALHRAAMTQVAPEERHRHSSEPAGKGLDPLVIASLPKFIYKPTEQQLDDCHDVIECSICLGTIEEEATVRLLPNCKHMFHVECIDMWLISNTTCPICRTVAEPTVIQPTAPPMGESMPHVAAAESEKAGGSGSRLSSFRRMLTGDRSSRRIQNCGDGGVGADDLERQ